MGRLTHTHTHTRYFGDDDISKLRQAAIAMAEDWEDRLPHIDAETGARGVARLQALRAAIELCDEPVAE
jgi:hypothetical protein